MFSLFPGRVVEGGVLVRDDAEPREGVAELPVLRAAAVEPQVLEHPRRRREQGRLAVGPVEGKILRLGAYAAATDRLKIGLQYEITTIGGYRSLFLSGEGLVAKFSGSGKLWLQTKKVRPLVYWANPFRPQKG